MSFSPNLYKHELDQKAFDALSIFPKFVKLRESYIANVDEKAAKINFLSSAIRLSENQFPEIYNLLPPICEKLGIVVPELYYIKSKKMNAATGGSTSPYIFITSELVEKIPTDLIATVLAHECGHIACQHYLYHSMASQLMASTVAPYPEYPLSENISRPHWYEPCCFGIGAANYLLTEPPFFVMVLRIKQ